MCDARNPQRVRLLAGKDPSCGELRERVEKLQVVYVYVHVHVHIHVYVHVYVH